MDKVNVLSLARMRLHREYIDDIAAVDPRISVIDGTEKFIADTRRRGKKGPRVDYFESEADLGGDWKAPETDEDLDTLLAKAEVIFGVLLFPDYLLLRAPRLKWIHLAGTGIDRDLLKGIQGGNVTITNSRGAVAIPIAEHVMAFMLMLAKNVSCLMDNKQNRRWEPFATMELRPRTVGIIGLGAVGSEIARLAKGIGMKVVATRRSATRRRKNVFGVDELYPVAELPQMLSGSDFVVIAVPLTAETERMIGEAELRVMKSTAYLINVGRGQIVDQTALIKVLREGSIAGAGLDVFETEPLPPDSELWKLPNVVLSYHMAGFADTYGHRITGLFCENLRRYLAGEQLLNLIGNQRGY